MSKGGRGAVIIQDSAGAGKAVLTNQSILKKHRMLASIKMPADLFNPNAIVQTSIYVFEAGVAHNFEYDIVKFIDFSNDGHKRNKRGISDIDHPAQRYQDLYLIYKLGLKAADNPKFHSNLWDLDSIYCEATISNSGKDWNFEQHMKFKTDPSDVDFKNAINSHLSWETASYINKLSHAGEVNPKAAQPVAKKEFVIGDNNLFVIDTTQSYNKKSLTDVTEQEYDYITRTATNRGICDVTGFIKPRGLNEPGTFSLGLLQMTFFYRERHWYAGQFVRKISCKYPLNKYLGIYFETLFNGLASCLSSNLVRDVDDAFLSSKIVLPITNDGEIDFEWIEQYVKEQKKNTLSCLYNEYTREPGIELG